MRHVIRRGILVMVAALLTAPWAVAEDKKDNQPQGMAQAKMANGSTTMTATEAEVTGSKQPAAGSQSPPAVSADYRIGVSDVLDVHVWKEPELSRVVPVRPDGKISLPLVGDLEVQDKTAAEILEIVADRLKGYVTEPEVTVIVREVNSKRFFVVGQVNKPGTFPLVVPVSVLEALAMAGGFQEWADRDNVLILRRTPNNGTERINFSYDKWIKKKQPVSYEELRNGDVVIVR
jgi:polysaccharide export outer membrane protein